MLNIISKINILFPEIPIIVKSSLDSTLSRCAALLAEEYFMEAVRVNGGFYCS